MKKTLLIIFLLLGYASFSQRGLVQMLPQSNNNRNLLDIETFKKAPIAFVPFTDGPEARKKGYKPDSIYSWVDPSGKRKRATGKEIMDQVNAVEKSMCERGHSLREARAFDGLNYAIPKTINPNALIKGKKFTLGGFVYSYFGSISNNVEFPGILFGHTIINRMPNDASTLSFPLILSMMPGDKVNISTMVIKIYDNPKKEGLPIFTIPVNIKSPSVQRNWSTQMQNNTGTYPIPQQKYSLYQFSVQFKNIGNKIPAPTRNHQYYYMEYLFTGTDGKPYIVSQQNEAILNNTLEQPINIPVAKSGSINKFNFELTDPIKNCFGLYARSNGFNASTSASPFGYKGIDNKSSFSADISIGAKYYNFEHLLNNSAPISNDLEIIGASFSASQSYYRPDKDNLPPPIRIPGEKNLLEHKDTKFEFRILGDVIPSNQTQITKEVFNQRFFIGPVPCKVSIKLQGTAGITASGTYTANSCDMKGKVEPFASLNVIGDGGVDAAIAYATVSVNVNLMTVKMPIEFNIDNPAKADVSSSLSVSGLSGSVNFNAGFCIPIPFFDDICKNFTIEIFKWDGLAPKNFAIDNSGVH